MQKQPNSSTGQDSTVTGNAVSDTGASGAMEAGPAAAMQQAQSNGSQAAQVAGLASPRAAEQSVEPLVGGRMLADQSSPEHGPRPVDRLADPESVVLSLPEHFSAHEEQLGKYKQFCVDCGFTGEQAQQAIDYYIDHQNGMFAAERDNSMQMLRDYVWAGRYEEQLTKANHAVQRLDREMGGRLMPVVEAGLGNNAVFAEMMAVVGNLLSEDSFSAHSGGPMPKHRPMSTLEFLQTEVFGD